MTAEDKLESAEPHPDTGACQEETPLVEQEPMETEISDTSTGAKLQETSANTSSSRPPTPTSVPCPVPLTSEDTLKLHGSFERKEDDLSLIVHVDDSQNDIDNDLLSDTSERKTGAKTDENVTGEEEAGKSKEDTEKPAAAAASATDSIASGEATKDNIDKPTDSEKTDTTQAQAQKTDPKEGSKDGEKAKRFVLISPSIRQANKRVKEACGVGAVFSFSGTVATCYFSRNEKRQTFFEDFCSVV